MSIVFRKNERDGTKLGIWKVEESIDELKHNLILNDEELDFYNKLNKGKRNLHWLSSRVLLRELLETNRFIEVRGDSHGKPHLINFDFEISITHSYEYAAVILSKKKVGIDIEIIKDKILKIALKFMNDRELEFVEGEDKIKKMYVIWCAKESIYKLHGKKELLFQDHIFVEPFDYFTEGKIIAEIKKNNISKTYDIQYLEFNDYMFTYVIDH